MNKIILYPMTRKEFVNKYLNQIKQTYKNNINSILRMNNTINTKNYEDLKKLLMDICKNLNNSTKEFIKNLQSISEDLSELFENDYIEDWDELNEEFTYVINEYLNVACIIKPEWFDKL
ncbi:hypothetical protein J6W34_04690 [bacterium]|nr:hypothetical protein [bacterium]